MLDDLDTFNDLTQRLWGYEEDEALATADAIFRDSSVLPGSGRSYPSAILYLRDPRRYVVWFNALDKGLAVLTDYRETSRQGGSDAYLEYCRRVVALAEEHSLAPQEIDAVLSSAARRAQQKRTNERERSETPTITRAAFEFLADLAENNDKEWFDENRDRYEAHLRDPFAAVLQEVAERYLVGLDPLLNVKVKTDEVLARIWKWSPGDPYYKYLWGAFSRTRKQEDVQLFVIIHPDRLHCGLYLSSAPEETRHRLLQRLEEAESEVVEGILKATSYLTFYRDDEHEPTPVDSREDLLEWAAGKQGELSRNFAPDDPLIGSPDLVDAIGEVLETVHPLAALAWGDDIPVGHVSPPTGIETGPEYTFEQLVDETLLPPETLQLWIELLNGPKRAALFYGPPGTGKTHVAERLARYLSGTEGDSTTVQFHPSFYYEDFIEGLRPEREDGQMTYRVRPGVFSAFCDLARGKDADYIFVIDEINRAEIGAVLGETMMLIEYRDRVVPLPYSQRQFSIPKNIVLLATMNTADRSLALVDFALRRRFHAIHLPPDREILAAHYQRTGVDGELALRMFDLVQDYVAHDDFAPGQTYWMMDDVSPESMETLWSFELLPYLREFWFESRARLNELQKEVSQLLAEGT